MRDAPEPIKASTTADVSSAPERDHVLRSMLRFVEEKPEQIKLFEELVAPYLVDQGPIVVLDACCGVGDLTYHLRELNPVARFTAIDNAQFVLDEATRLFADDARVTIENVDVGDLVEHFGPNSFDLVFCKQALPAVADYRAPVTQLMEVARGSVFISALFYDGRIDYDIRLREHAGEGGAGRASYQNIHSLPLFREFCLDQGAREVAAFDFAIGIDLPRPSDPNRMGTYTVRLDTGERLQVSGAMLMPWKIVRIDV